MDKEIDGTIIGVIWVLVWEGWEIVRWGGGVYKRLEVE